MSQSKDIYKALMAYIQNLQTQPSPSNPAQDRITEQSLKGSKWLEGRDFRNMKDAGMFFDFEQPAEQEKRQNMIANSFQGGTFGMADNAGESAATRLEGKYLSDRRARDDSANFQQNIEGAAAGVKQGLVESSNATLQANSLDQSRRLAALNSLTSMYNRPQQPGILGSIIGAGAGVAGAAITHGGF